MWMPIHRAIEKYNEIYVVEFENGLVATNWLSEYIPYCWQPTLAEWAQQQFMAAELINPGLHPFGKGNPLIFTDLAAYVWEISTGRKALGFKVDRDMMREDRAGVYGKVAYGLGEAARRSPRDRFWLLMTGPAFNGAGGFLTMDDTTLFSTSHPYRPIGSPGQRFYSNRMTAKFSRGSYEEAIRLLRMARSMAGKEVNRDVTFHVVTSSKYEPLLRRIFLAALTEQGGSNTVHVPQKFWCCSYLDELFPEYWYVFALSRNPMFRPVIYRIDQPPELVSDLDPNSESIWENNEYRWRAEGKYGMGPGFPYTVVGSDGTTAAL